MSGEPMTIPSRTLAQMSGAAYHSVGNRPDIGQYEARAHLAGPRTAVFEGPNDVVIAHRGTVWSDFQDVADDARIAIGNQIGKKRISDATRISKAAQKFGKPISHTGHSLGGAVARKVARDRGQPNTTFSRWTGLSMNPENKSYSKQCSQGRDYAFCNNTTDYYNSHDMATSLITQDYGKKKRSNAQSRGMQADHALEQFATPAPAAAQESIFAGSGRFVVKKPAKEKVEHPQKDLLALALKMSKG